MRITLFSFLVILIACNSPSREEKAKRLIKDHLFKTLHDYKSYESVEFGKMDSLFTYIEDDSLYKYYIKEGYRFLDEVKDANSNLKIYAGLSTLRYRFDYYKAIAAEYNDSVSQYIRLAEKVKSNFTPLFIGWKMSHTYRAKSLNGNKGIHHYAYKFDKEISKIIGHDDIGVDDDGKHEDL